VFHISIFHICHQLQSSADPGMGDRGGLVADEKERRCNLSRHFGSDQRLVIPLIDNAVVLCDCRFTTLREIAGVLGARHRSPLSVHQHHQIEPLSAAS
jgi:hypothetical protein